MTRLLALLALLAGCRTTTRPGRDVADAAPQTAPATERVRFERCPVGHCGAWPYDSDEVDREWIANTPRVSVLGDLLFLYCACPPRISNGGELPPESERFGPAAGRIGEALTVWCECPEARTATPARSRPTRAPTAPAP